MKFRHKEIEFPAIAPEPTIWALRKNPRAANSPENEASSQTDLYQHLFGYDPISLIRPRRPVTEQGVTSAENPNLNIINPETNFAVMELASDLEPEQS